MRKLFLFTLPFLVCFLETKAFSLPNNTTQVESIQKIAESLRRSLNHTLGQRQKAVARGMESKFDTTFEEAQTVLDSLFQEIHNFLKMQNTNEQNSNAEPTLHMASDKLNQNTLEKLAYFQTLMEHLQASINELNPSNDSALKPQTFFHKSERVSATVNQKGRRKPRMTSSKKLNNDQDPLHNKPYVKYQVSGAQILPPDPADESFIH